MIVKVNLNTFFRHLLYFLHYIILDTELIFNQKAKSPSGLLKDADDGLGNTFNA